MLAETSDSPFDNKDWVFEIKYDGYRIISVLTGNSNALFSRNAIDYTKQFASISKELKKITHQAILDGEVVVENENGKSDFQLLQNFQKTGRGKISYYVFDILNLDGADTTKLPLLERKELLHMLLEKYTFNNIYYSDHIFEKGKEFFGLAQKNVLEGIMAKEADSLYYPGKRSASWQKIKIIQEDEAIIVGITKPKGGRQHFGALLLAQYENDKLVYIGNCGTGFSDIALKELYTQFKPYFIENTALAVKPKIPASVQWIKPHFICKVKFTERTNENHLRHPVYMGLRDDKNLKEVTTMKKTIKKTNTKSSEKTAKSSKKTNAKSPKITKTSAKKTNTKAAKKEDSENDYLLNVGKVELHLTNQNKIYFPGEGITKGDIVNYYQEISNYILPYLKGRPQSMNRFPNGIKGSSFYQKDIDVKKSPDWLITESVFSESNNKNIDYLLCNDKATLLYMANLGCIEFNPWNSTIQHLENPDWLVIDIDPDKNPFEDVVETALTVRDILEGFGVKSYCKTSGATGLHVYIPLAAKYDYDIVKIFAEYVAKEVEKQMPEKTTTIRNIKQRKHKIYIDFLQNRRGQTLAAPYSVRPKPGATVSAPLEWKEVNNKLSPSMFTIYNMKKRLEKKGDLWKPVLGRGINLEKIIKQISG